MKAVFPWQKCDEKVYSLWYHKNEQHTVREVWILYDIKFLIASHIFYLTNNNKSFYLCKTYTSIFPTWQQKEFNTLSKAKTYIDKQLKKMNVKLLQPHMLTLL